MLTIKENISYSTGFTLIELLITIVIVGLIASIGIPSFTQTIRSSRLTTNANQLIASLSLARSEAIKRNGTVFVRRKGATSQNGDIGWDVFIDLNANQTEPDKYPQVAFHDDGVGTNNLKILKMRSNLFLNY